jgi:hypothetical protein
MVFQHRGAPIDHVFDQGARAALDQPAGQRMHRHQTTDVDQVIVGIL